ncbi:Gfo/Idh/MocA family protein [Peribacillus sp. NPDC058002]|uniref:Gfo/Idh/MocA family protein n=1 Tax=Peribacillus sp. NPDC058002 TaxID=3346301 RepID=UPI0036D7E9BB
MNIVLIGTGTIAHNRHLPSVKNNKTAKLYGVYNRTIEKAQQVARQYNCKVFDDMASIWKDNNVNAVIICTPPSSHCDIATQALNAKKHVLVEKPMAMSELEAIEMNEAAKSNGCILMVSYNQRLYQPHLKAKELIANGEIGDLLTFRTFLGNPGSNLQHYKQENEWRDSLGDIGSHRLDLMNYILERKPNKVFGHLFNVWGIDSYFSNNGVAIIQYEDQITGTFIFSFTSFGANDRMTQFFGTKGKITLYSDAAFLTVEKGIEEKQVYSFLEELPQHKIEMTDIVDRFISYIEKNEKPFVTGEDGIKVMRLIDAIRQSSKDGQWVTLAEE